MQHKFPDYLNLSLDTSPAKRKFSQMSNVPWTSGNTPTARSAVFKPGAEMISKLLGKSPSYTGESYFSAGESAPYSDAACTTSYCDTVGSSGIGSTRSRDDKDSSTTGPPNKKAKSYVV
jgi:hypothetical protein